MDHQQLLADLVERTRVTVGGLWRRHQSGELDRDDFVLLASATLAVANQSAGVTMDVAAAVILTELEGVPVDPVGVELPEVFTDTDRLEEALRTAIEDEETAESRVELIGRSEPAAAAAAGMLAALVAHRVGWVRQTDSDPCPLCVKWADGRVRPPDMPMIRHTGCQCIQRPAR